MLNGWLHAEWSKFQQKTDGFWRKEMSNNTTIVSGNGKEEVVVVVDHDNNLPEQIYNTLIVVQWVLNLTSLTMALYFMNRTKKTSLIHPNLRTLLVSACAFSNALLWFLLLCRIMAYLGEGYAFVPLPHNAYPSPTCVVENNIHKRAQKGRSQMEWYSVKLHNAKQILKII